MILPTLGPCQSVSVARVSRSVMKQMIASWSMVMIRALLVAGSGIKPRIDEIAGSRSGRAAGAHGSPRRRQCSPEGCGMDRSRTEAPKTRVYFTAHRSGAFPVLRLRTVARGWRSGGQEELCEVISTRTSRGAVFAGSGASLEDGGLGDPAPKDLSQSARGPPPPFLRISHLS